MQGLSPVPYLNLLPLWWTSLLLVKAWAVMEGGGVLICSCANQTSTPTRIFSVVGDRVHVRPWLWGHTFVTDTNLFLRSWQDEHFPRVVRHWLCPQWHFFQPSGYTPFTSQLHCEPGWVQLAGLPLLRVHWGALLRVLLDLNELLPRFGRLGDRGIWRQTW